MMRSMDQMTCHEPHLEKKNFVSGKETPSTELISIAARHKKNRIRAREIQVKMTMAWKGSASKLGPIAAYAPGVGAEEALRLHVQE